MNGVLDQRPEDEVMAPPDGWAHAADCALAPAAFRHAPAATPSTDEEGEDEPQAV